MKFTKIGPVKCGRKDGRTDGPEEASSTYSLSLLAWVRKYGTALSILLQDIFEVSPAVVTVFSLLISNYYYQ
jgi:hypothetical protein